MVFRRPKIAVIGAGYTGATTALMLAQKELGDVVLLDIPELDRPTKGKSLDLLQTGPIQRLNVHVKGSSSYEAINQADMVIITAGRARKPGMSREELISINGEIIQSISYQIARHAPESYVIVLSNPVDAMTYVCYKATQFPKNRVIGQSGILDTARFNTFVAEELGISVEDVTGFVLGGHGDEMAPIVRYSYVGGIPLDLLLSKKRIEEIVERTRKGGGEIVELLGNGSAYYAPAASLVQMAEAIIRDKKKILPAVAYLEGEFAYRDICLGVPTILGGRGLESIIELPLTPEEQTSLDVSAKKVEETIHLIKTSFTFQSY
jgi:malate dehydrogenase